MTRRTRLAAAHLTLTGEKYGPVKWFRDQLAAHLCGHTKSVVYRWFDDENVVDGDYLEGVLQVLEADAELSLLSDADRTRLDDAEATIAELKEKLR